MDPSEGEAVQRNLWKFLEIAATESAPSDQGWALFDELEHSVGKLAKAYETQTPPAESQPELEPTSEPQPLPAPEVKGPPSEELLERLTRQPEGKDNWFVAIFQRMNEGDMWYRQPGDKLTLRQKVDMIGLTFLILLFAGLVIGMFMWIFTHPEDWNDTPQHHY